MQHRPNVPDFWHVLIGTNLTRLEILALEERGFQLQRQQEVSPRSITINTLSLILSYDYRITISTFPSCTCPDFVVKSIKTLGKRCCWVYCKHLYFIFYVTCNLDQYQDTYIHAPSLIFNEVKHLFESGIVKHVGP